jgi:hypothetical protein
MFGPEPLEAHPEARPFSTGKIAVPFHFSPTQNRWLKNTISKSNTTSCISSFMPLAYLPGPAVGWVNFFGAIS